MKLSAALPIILGLMLAGPAASQTTPAQRSYVATAAQYRVVSNVVYGVADGFETKLDLYLPRGQQGPRPTLIQFHGGGWVGGSKEGSSLSFLPYLEMGWAVVNVGYRLGRVGLAPAAVEDGLCALRWVIRNAEQYGIDANRLVLTGYSAGGHLSLTTGMTPASAGLDRQCPGNEPLRVAAVVNWYGITDVGDLLDGDNMKSYAVQWMGSMPNRYEIAERVSPLTYVRAGLPPILTIHGDADPTVPYDHALRLRDSLDRAGVPNRLHTVPGGGHGNFTVDEFQGIYEVIRGFLAEHVTR
ncbi:MAG: alpha/beta hydrolase [Gemmatimonadetes bacterium]|nr:alpha/beta hydrolase [Gemmatimonadota bacterium]MDA1104415.1 alpha/beta hydrolase [Gemmatimonadota bacterium]